MTDRACRNLASVTWKLHILLLSRWISSFYSYLSRIWILYSSSPSRNARHDLPPLKEIDFRLDRTRILDSVCVRVYAVHMHAAWSQARLYSTSGVGWPGMDGRRVPTEGGGMRVIGACSHKTATTGTGSCSPSMSYSLHSLPLSPAFLARLNLVLPLPSLAGFSLSCPQAACTKVRSFCARRPAYRSSIDRNRDFIRDYLLVIKRFFFFFFLGISTDEMRTSCQIKYPPITSLFISLYNLYMDFLYCRSLCWMSHYYDLINI